MGASSTKPPVDKTTHTAHNKVLLPPIYAIPSARSLTTTSKGTQPLPLFDALLEQDRRIFRDYFQTNLSVYSRSARDIHVSGTLFPFFTLHLERPGNISGCTHHAVTLGPTDYALRWGLMPHLALQARGTRQQGWLGLESRKTIRIPRSKPQESKEYYRNDPFASQTHQKAEPLDLCLDTWIGVHVPTRTLSDCTVCAATSWRGVTAAMEAKLPFHPANGPDYTRATTRSYLRLNLTDPNDSNSSESSTPPLQLALHHQHNSTTQLSLSQTLFFDRYQINPFEDRAALVRNPLHWAVSLQHTDQNTAHSSVAVAWQVNRAVALKAKMESSSTVAAVCVLKQWKEPFVTCALQYRYQASGRSVWGLGVEVGQRQQSHDSVEYPPHQRDSKNSAPPTIVTTKRTD